LSRISANNTTILANPSIDPLSPTDSLSHLELSRALFREKQTAEGRTEYQPLFDAWKNAGADLTLLQRAKREYVGLDCAGHR
jgi:hypothetical protein